MCALANDRTRGRNSSRLQAQDARAGGTRAREPARERSPPISAGPSKNESSTKTKKRGTLRVYARARTANVVARGLTPDCEGEPEPQLRGQFGAGWICLGAIVDGNRVVHDGSDGRWRSW